MAGCRFRRPSGRCPGKPERSVATRRTGRCECPPCRRNSFAAMVFPATAKDIFDGNFEIKLEVDFAIVKYAKPISGAIKCTTIKSGFSKTTPASRWFGYLLPALSRHFTVPVNSCNAVTRWKSGATMNASIEKSLVGLANRRAFLCSVCGKAARVRWPHRVIPLVSEVPPRSAQ
jgi:hypothetical protein